MKNVNSTYFRSLTSQSFRGLVAGMTVCFLTVTRLVSAETGSDVSARISHASVLYQNLVPVGGTPAEVESSVLWSMVEQMRHGRVDQTGTGSIHR